MPDPSNKHALLIPWKPHLGGAVHADGQVLGHVALLNRADDCPLHVGAELEQLCSGWIPGTIVAVW